MAEKDKQIKKYKEIALKTPGRQSITRLNSARSFSKVRKEGKPIATQTPSSFFKQKEHVELISHSKGALKHIQMELKNQIN